MFTLISNTINSNALQIRMKVIKMFSFIECKIIIIIIVVIKITAIKNKTFVIELFDSANGNGNAIEKKHDFMGKLCWWCVGECTEKGCRCIFQGHHTLTQTHKHTHTHTHRLSQIHLSILYRISILWHKFYDINTKCLLFTFLCPNRCISKVLCTRLKSISIQIDRSISIYISYFNKNNYNNNNNSCNKKGINFFSLIFALK